MHVTFEVPEDVARALGAQHRPINQAAIEALAAEGYRTGLLSESQVRRLLNLPSRFAVHEWLSERHIPYRYTEADLDSDLAALSELGLH